MYSSYSCARFFARLLDRSASLCRPLCVPGNAILGTEFFLGVEGASQLLFRKLVMNKIVAFTAEDNPSVLHFIPAETFLKPLIGVASLGNQMVKGQITR